jgi:hypothetical protein
VKENGRENVTVRIRIETDIVTVSSIFRFLFRFMAMNSIVLNTGQLGRFRVSFVSVSL